MTAEPTYRLEGIVHAKADAMEDFVGPLDVILVLLSKNKVEIKDVKIAVILEQYLDYLEQMKKMDLEIASEFISMASYLIYLKSKTLLVADDEPDTEMEQFLKSLETRKMQEEHVKVQSLAQILGPRYESGKNLMAHQPEPLPPDKTYRYVHSPEDLTAALRAIIVRTEQKLPPPAASFEGIVGHEPYPVEEKTGEIIKRLLKNGVMKLKNLFIGSRSRSEIVATFISILELSKGNRITLAGDDDDCTVSCTGGDGSDG